jgi:hypothetical protein
VLSGDTPAAIDQTGRLAMITWRAMFSASAGICLAVSCGFAAAEAVKCTLAKVAQWPVCTERNLLLVEGAIDGQPVDIMLDTGAARTLVFRTAATRLGLNVAGSSNYRQPQGEIPL